MLTLMKKGNILNVFINIKYGGGILFNEIISKSFMKQKMMRTVIKSLIPVTIASIYFFGWRSLILLLVVTIFGLGTEWIFAKKYKRKVSEAVFVSCILYTLVLPPTTPFWIAVVGIIFGIMFSKEVFGGFGKNIYNPALAARAFVYVCFPAPLTMGWTKSAMGLPGGFGTYITQTVDTMATATPMLAFRESGVLANFTDLLFGNTAGSLGETSAILIILAGIYLIYKKVASWEIMLGTILGFAGLSSILILLGNTEIPNVLYGIFSGGLIFGAVFMATDPISAPKTKEAKWIYGLLIGIITVIIRGYSLFAGGIMFAILISNTFVPIMDEGVKYLKKRKREKQLEKEVVA